MKRTDFGDAEEGFLRDFLRKDDEEVMRGRSEAWAKSLVREGSLGWEIVEAVVGVGWPWNWDARSLYWDWSLWWVSDIVREALI